MRKKEINISVNPWAALVAGLLVYFADAKTLLLLTLPVLIHESGHLICLRLLDCRICSLRWEPSGLCIRYSGDPGQWGHAAAALAGPTAGLIYAWLSAKFGADGELSAGISLLLSVFNLIPAMPLDGGRVAQALLDSRKAKRLSLFAAFAAEAVGLYLYFRRKGAALLIAGLFLLAEQFRQGRSSESSPD